MKKLLLLLMICAWTGQAFATAQIPDSLVYQGETHPIFSNPLESYFDKDHPRPQNVFVFSCTACWRGYVAMWTIEERFLYLTKLKEGTCSRDAKEIDLSRVFPGQKGQIKATWFSGALRIPMGERLHYVHMGYGSLYEKTRVLTIERGKLTNDYVVDNTKERRPPRTDIE